MKTVMDHCTMHIQNIYDWQAFPCQYWKI